MAETRRLVNIDHSQVLNSHRQPGIDQCLLALVLESPNHSGPCYTLDDRVARGFGHIRCGRPECTHPAANHTVDAPQASNCDKCGCDAWREDLSGDLLGEVEIGDRFPTPPSHAPIYDPETGACAIVNCVNTKAVRTMENPELRILPHALSPTCTPVFKPGFSIPFVVEGVGPDTPTKTDKNGASQSDIPYAFHTMPVRAVMSLAQLQSQGDAKYGAFNWCGISLEDHVNHAITHLMAWLAGDRSDNHLQHGAWRALAALESDLQQQDGAQQMLDYWKDEMNG